MAESNEPKKETVRITLPPRGPASAPTSKDETVELNLPADAELEEKRTPPLAPPLSRPSGASPLTGSPVPPPPTQSTAPARRLVPPPPPPAAVPPTSTTRVPLPRPPAPAAPSNVPAVAPAPAPTSQPKKETSRINLMPEPPRKETARIPTERPKTVKMTKTQPLVTVTATPVPPLAPVNVALPAAAEPRSAISSIPLGLCWALVAVAAAILLIEIWTYIS